jgi:phosphoserine phosphatase
MLLLLDFDGTLIRTNSTSLFYQKKKGATTVDGRKGLVIRNEKGEFCYQKDKQVLDMHNAIPQAEIDALLSSEKDGLKESELVAKTIRHALDAGMKVAIVTKSLYPEIIVRALELILKDT